LPSLRQVKCDPRHGKYMACCMMYRTQAQSKAAKRQGERTARLRAKHQSTRGDEYTYVVITDCTRPNF
jgi:hypothetical protein